MGGDSTHCVKLSVCLYDWLINAIFDPPKKKQEQRLSVRPGSLPLISSFRTHRCGFHNGELNVSSRGKKGREGMEDFRFISPQPTSKCGE